MKLPIFNSSFTIKSDLGHISKLNDGHIQMRSFSAVKIILSALVLISTPLIANASDSISVFMNHARILKFDEPVSSVIVGNSEIADVTVGDPTTVILTAKSYGTTNLVILDKDGDAIIDKRIVVSVDEENSVRVFRQVERSVLSCSPVCEKQGDASN